MITNRIKNIYNRYIWWTGNEKRIAKRLLDITSKKLWVSFKELLAVLNADKQYELTFKVEPEYNTLLIQVVYKVMNTRSIQCTEDKTIVIVRWTKQQRDMIDRMFWLYQRQYDLELRKLEKKYEHEKEIMEQSFIHKHKLYGTETNDSREFTKKELERYNEIRNKMEDLDDLDIWDKILD